MRVRTGVVVVGALLCATVVVPAAHAAEGVRYVDEVFQDVVITRDIPFGSAVNSRGEVQELLLDLYEPAGDEATDRGLYIWAHGSGFRVGSKLSANPLTEYAKHGWVGMSITYRLRPELVPNAAIGILTNPAEVAVAQAAAKDAQHDMQAAVRWARANAGPLGIDPDRIAVGGISAGGIMALMTAFNPTDVGNSGTPGVSSHVAAAVSHAGAYAPVLQGAFPQAGAPAVAMYHGTTDEQVPFPTSPPACVLTIAMGNACEYVTFVGRTHRTMGTDLALDFLHRHVILGRGELRLPLVTDTTDDLTVLAGIEPPVGPAPVLGAVVPTDTQLLIDETTKFVEYVLNALGLAP